MTARQPSRFVNVKMFLVSFVFLVSTSHVRAQELEANGKNGNAIFSPADYVEVSTPLTDRIGVNAYAFYLGNVQAGIGLVEVPIKASKHVSFTSSYLYIKVPAAGLSLLTGETEATPYQEHQFRQAATVSTTWSHFSLSDRNMYVRRFTPTGDVNRYRNKIYVARQLSFGSYRCSPFIFDEVYHDFAPGGWLRRNWIVGGVDMPVNRYLTFQASYIRQDDQFLRSVNFLGVALIVHTGKLFGRD
jgi:hypothetical protein